MKRIIAQIGCRVARWNEGPAGRIVTIGGAAPKSHCRGVSYSLGTEGRTIDGGGARQHGAFPGRTHVGGPAPLSCVRHECRSAQAPHLLLSPPPADPPDAL